MSRYDEYLGVNEVAELMGISVRGVYSLRHRGRGPIAFARGRRLLYKRSDVEAYLAYEKKRTLRGETVPA